MSRPTQHALAGAESSMLKSRERGYAYETIDRVKKAYGTVHTEKQGTDNVLEELEDFLVKEICKQKNISYEKSQFDSLQKKYDLAKGLHSKEAQALRALTDSTNTTMYVNYLHKGAGELYPFHRPNPEGGDQIIEHINLRELLSYMWLAASDPSLPEKDKQPAIDNFITQLADCRTAHNEDVTHPRKKRLIDSGELDAPSCSPGHFGRIMLAGSGNPIATLRESPAKHYLRLIHAFIYTSFKEETLENQFHIANALGEQVIMMALDESQKPLMNFIKNLTKEKVIKFVEDNLEFELSKDERTLLLAEFEQKIHFMIPKNQEQITEDIARYNFSTKEYHKLMDLHCQSKVEKEGLQETIKQEKIELLEKQIKPTETALKALLEKAKAKHLGLQEKLKSFEKTMAAYRKEGSVYDFSSLSPIKTEEIIQLYKQLTIEIDDFENIENETLTMIQEMDNKTNFELLQKHIEFYDESFKGGETFNVGLKSDRRVNLVHIKINEQLIEFGTFKAQNRRVLHEAAKLEEDKSYKESKKVILKEASEKALSRKRHLNLFAGEKFQNARSRSIGKAEKRIQKERKREKERLKAKIALSHLLTNIHSIGIEYKKAEATSFGQRYGNYTKQRQRQIQALQAMAREQQQTIDPKEAALNALKKLNEVKQEIGRERHVYKAKSRLEKIIDTNKGELEDFLKTQYGMDAKAIEESSRPEIR